MEKIDFNIPTQAQLQSIYSKHSAEGDIHFLLEFNEDTQQFHYNAGEDEPSTFGWEPLAIMPWRAASQFCEMIEIIKYADRKEKVTLRNVKLALAIFTLARMASSEVSEKLRAIYPERFE